MISSRTYTALARRDLEIAPTNVGASVRLETARISIALIIHSLDPTGNACRDREIAPTNGYRRADAITI